MSRYTGGFGFSTPRVVATFPTRGDAKLRSIDCPWDTDKGPARATITGTGPQLEIDLHGADPAFSGSMKLNYKKDPRRHSGRAADDGAAVSGGTGFRLSLRRGASKALVGAD